MPDKIHELADRMEALPDGAKFTLEIVIDEQKEAGSTNIQNRVTGVAWHDVDPG
jgi:hypothetical protein